MEYTVLLGDCIEQMRTLPDQSVHTCVTSPPYFGLRDYGHEGQIGLEETPDAFVAKLVEVFREVRRVLRDDGTLWLNLGDSYATSTKGDNRSNAQERPRDAGGFHSGSGARWATGTWKVSPGLPEKNLLGIPWRVAFALQADGWYLRQDIIWHKPNPMPESVRDRCTKAHEYVFLLSKGPRYYFDAEAIAQPLAETSKARLSQPTLAEQAGSDRVPGKTNGAMKAVGPRFGGAKYGDDDAEMPRTKSGNEWKGGAGKANRRSVWTVTTKPFKGAHFATFPPDLIEPCVLAGAPLGGTVLDPFGGSGTTAGVAVKHGRKAILCELNPEYAALIPDRVLDVAGDTGDLFLRAAE
jgi:DNA modification methylase